MSVHRIRLLKPWRRETTPGGSRWLRRFGRPTGLGPAERVWLVVEAIEGQGIVWLNDQLLGSLQAESPPGTARWDVTERLSFRNEVAIAVEALVSTELPGDVSLEIESELR